MKHQHPGDFIGVHASLQVHLRPWPAAVDTPGAYAQLGTGITGYGKGYVLDHLSSLLCLASVCSLAKRPVEIFRVAS